MASDFFTYEKTYDYFQLNYYKKDKLIEATDNLNKKLKEIYEYYVDEKYAEIKRHPMDKQGSYYCGISNIVLKKIKSDDPNEKRKLWIFNIERINVSENSTIGDITKDIKTGRSEQATSKEQGPLIDTICLFNPINRVLIIPRNRGGVSVRLMEKFIRKLTKDRGLTLDLVTELDGLNKIEHMDEVKEVQYSVAMPENLSGLKKKDRSIWGDFKLMNYLGGKKIYMTMKLDSSLQKNNRDHLLNKVKDLAKRDSSKIKIVGQHNLDKQVIDLISKKMEYIDTITLPKDKKISIEDMMESVRVAYESNQTMLEKLYG